MLKQSPSRNQRPKGFKVKHALQICLLLAICIWLLYQVKKSYDKKGELEEISRQLSKEVRNGHEIFKLGRKDLNPQLEEIAAEFKKHGDEELELDDEEIKLRENERERGGGGDDEIDGHDLDKVQEEEPEQLEDLIDEDDKEIETGSEWKESAESNKDIEDDGLLNNQDHRAVKRDTEKAKEEHYKGDDAQLITTVNKFGVLRAVEEEEQVKNVGKNELELKNKTISSEESIL